MLIDFFRLESIFGSFSSSYRKFMIFLEEFMEIHKMERKKTKDDMLMECFLFFLLHVSIEDSIW